MARALIVFLGVVVLVGFCVSSPCHECGQKALAGCIAFGEGPNDQSLELMCPEVHVGQCSNPCAMTTQAYSVPKSMCSAPYCSLPAPQPMCSLPMQPVCPPPPPSMYPQTTCCTTQPQPCPCQKQPPPRPMQQYQGYCMPYPYPSQMPAAAPSYCVQSVVVGGKAEQKDEEKPSRHNQPPRAPRTVGEPGGRVPGTVGEPGGRVPGTVGEPGGRAPGTVGEPGGRPGGIDPSRAQARDPRLGAGLDPQRLSGGTGGGERGGLGGGVGSGGLASGRLGALTGRDPLIERRRPREDDTKRYETYLEKILDVIRDKVEPECCDPSPIMVVHQPQPRVRVRKIRRRKQRKYMVESCCEDPDDVVVEEEEETSPCIFTAPVCRSCCSCRRRHRSYGARRYDDD